MIKNLSRILATIMIVAVQSAGAQVKDNTLKTVVYRETAPRINDLVHTKLEVRFDYNKSWMYGKAWITLQPHFYSTDSLTLDAKGMEIQKVGIVSGEATMAPLKYTYDGMQLHIALGRTYSGKEKYTVYIDYIAKPEELKVEGSAAITDAKGLYFINPRGENKKKPVQIWTQGETEASSAWFPTIDQPNQKTTEEIYMTVPDKYVTLSNGRLVNQKNNGDGTRTDYWSMELPHAPYLFFMGIGDYAIVKDTYKGKEVNYYVEKEYEKVARKIFGYTPEMMEFFSRITGVEYPWVKYSQIVGRDYVSGAMENTTATLHQESAQQDARELKDGNRWENTIAHELFHHWFGDLVTAESWSNLTVNESFANYSEYLWQEYKYGKDAAGDHNLEEMEGYLQSMSEQKDLVRFYYRDKEDMFDAVSYNKGGRILHMLRNHVGDSAFFKALNLYLTTNKFKSAEAHQLRLAFEEVTGKDLNWFWNQWYYGSGHPQLDISYAYDDTAKKVTVTINQTQAGDKVFALPIAIDIYNGSTKTRHNVWIRKKAEVLSFDYTTRPDLVNVDADKMLLCEKKDNKTLDNFIYQYKYAGNYLDRREAIDACASQQQYEPKALELLRLALKDNYAGIREYTLEKLDMKHPTVRKAVETALADIAQHDKESTVRAQAIALLGEYDNKAYEPVFLAAISDSSYSVAGAGLQALLLVNSEAAMTEMAKIKSQPARGRLAEAVSGLLMMAGSEEDFETVAGNFEKMPMGQDKLEALRPFAQYVGKIKDTDKVKRGVDLIVAVKNAIPAAYRTQLVPFINNVVLAGIISQKSAELKGSSAAAAKEQIGYIKSKM